MELLPIRDYRGPVERMARWFGSKWGIPAKEYEESMEACRKKEGAVPQWYVVLDGDAIVAGAGVIDNDFHRRKDLAPNLCALYVEEDYRCRGIAGRILESVARDLQELGVDTLYLVTEHTAFYERYGWEFLCMVQAEDCDETMRMYVHRMGPPAGENQPG